MAETETPPNPGFAREASPESSPEPEAVWTFRGYKLHSSEFTTAMIHYYRGEVQRANVWRSRLDATTNWAVIATGAALTVSFSQSGFHGIIYLNALLITLFLYIEARRYRYYELWSSRIRLMETDFFAAMLVPPFQPASDWAESLAESLLQPHFPISMWEAFGRRLRRNFIWIYIILALAWTAKVALYPTAATSWSDFFSRASVGELSGVIIVAFGLVFILTMILIAFFTSGMHQATGEVFPRFEEANNHVPGGKEEEPAGGFKPWFRFSQRRRQLVALIITDRSQAVGDHILKELKRGVTALQGTGLYTGKSHSLLLCALTVTEVNHLKALVSEIDPQAFVIVSPAQEILGRGFVPLQHEEVRGN